MKRISAILNLILSLVLIFSFSGNLWADEWEEFTPATKPPPLYGHTMVEINGSLYVFGGFSSAASSPLNEGEDTDELLSVPPIPLPAPMNDLWKYDPGNNSWNDLNPDYPPPSRHSHSAAVSNGKMFVFFGEDASGNVLNDIWSYTPGTNSWKQEVPAGPYPDGRFNHTSVTLPNGRILTFGGLSSGGFPVCPFPWAYNPATGAWEERSPHPVDVFYGHSAVVIGSQMYVYGGMGYQGLNNDIWAYDYVQDRWIKVPPGGQMPPGRLFHAAAPLGNKMYVFGGEASGTQQALNDAWIYDPATNTWIPASNMPVGLGQSQAASCSLLLLEGPAPSSDPEEEGGASSSAIVLFGGLSGSGPVNRMFVYFPEESPPPVTEYILTVTKAGTGSGTVTGSGINCGSDCSETYSEPKNVKLTAKVDANSTFTGWSGGGCSGTGTCQVTVDEEVTVTAGFSLKVPDISVAQTSVDFGSAAVGKSVKKTLAVTNNGAGELSITLEGLSGTDFSTTASTVKVKANKTYKLKLTFKASSSGQKTATLRINSNDPDTPTIDVSLNGTGQ